MTEFDIPKDEERQMKWLKFAHDIGLPLGERIRKEGLCKGSSWSDGTGHIVEWQEFEDIDAFGKLWSDKEYRDYLIGFYSRVDNVRYRLLWSALPPKPD